MTPVKFKRLWSEPSKQGVRQGRMRGKGKKNGRAAEQVGFADEADLIR